MNLIPQIAAIEVGTSISEWALLTTALISILLPILAAKIEMPLLSVFGRWVRWFLFASIFAFIIAALEWSFRPYWVHFITGLGLWFLLETGYNWIAIKALSQSEIPLFPSFKENSDGDDWPAEERLITLRDWLRKQDYKRLSGLKAKLFEETFLRASIYESDDALTRIQILFIPKRKGGAQACFTITTKGKEDRRVITDNLFLPYGGYYPEGWEIARKPMIGSLKRLLALHSKRLSKSSIEPVKFEDEALQELNEQQRILERLNMESGFLSPHNEREENGKISSEGRYRLWKEMWLLAYLGKVVRS